MINNAFIRRLGVAGLLGIALAVLLVLLAPRHARQAAEIIRAPLDARYRQPVVVAMPEDDSHLLTALRSHAPRWPRAAWEPAWSMGSSEAIERADSGETHFAVVRSNHQHDLSTIAWLGEEHLHVVVTAESPMAAFSDLAGARVGIGPAFSDTAMLADRLLSAFRLDPPAESLAMPMVAMLDALDAGGLEAVLMLAPVQEPVMAELLAGGAYRLLPIPQHAALSRSLHGVRAAHIPAGAYGPNRGIPSLESGDLPTVSVDILLAAPAAAPYWHAWSVVRAAQSPAFARAAPWRHGAVQRDLREAGLPLHAAARDFLRRGEPAPGGRIERIGFIIAAMFLVAGAVAVLRSRKRNREQMERRAAVVPYFESVEKLRHAVERARVTGDLRSIQNGLAQIQQQAEDEWLEGYLDTADMGNLYAALAGGSARAERRQLRMEMNHLREQLEQVQRGLQGAPRPEPPRPAASPPPRVKPPEIDDELEEDVPSILLEPGQDDDSKGAKR